MLRISLVCSNTYTYVALRSSLRGDRELYKLLMSRLVLGIQGIGSGSTSIINHRYPQFTLLESEG